MMPKMKNHEISKILTLGNDVAKGMRDLRRLGVRYINFPRFQRSHEKFV